MILSFTLTMSACLLIFLAAATVFTVAFGDRPRLKVPGGEKLRPADPPSYIVMTALTRCEGPVL